MPQYFGAHAYVLTQRGAQVLRRYCFPVDHQVDGLFLTLQQMSLLRVHMTPVSVVKQCMNHMNRSGSWHTHAVATPPTLTQSETSHTVLFLKGAVPLWSAALTVVALVVIVTLVLLRRT
jgi:hypothetical protein